MKFKKTAVLIGLATLLLLPEFAYAQSTGGPALNLLQRVLDWLGGQMARYIAGIALILIGFACYDGRIEWDKIKAWVFGSACVFGYAQIVALMSGG